MGTATQAAPASAPQVTVHDVMAGKVYLPEFIKQCRALGIEPANDQQLGSLLEIAQTVRVHQMKAAAEGQSEPDQFEKAANAARALMAQEGLQDFSAYLNDPEIQAAFTAGGIPA